MIALMKDDRPVWLQALDACHGDADPGLAQFLFRQQPQPQVSHLDRLRTLSDRVCVPQCLVEGEIPRQRPGLLLEDRFLGVGKA
ncbi:hypothetical protein D3C72_747480 [compost metagenome]